MRQDHLCGLSCWHPAWLQKFAKTKCFMLVYGLLGTVQAMSYLYLVVTLTTIEKRFKIPSQTTGIILSGNEISQILFSLILSYAGGQRNRPRWIAWGMVCCGLSCFILALPHFIYGPGEEALELTQEYQDKIKLNITLVNQRQSSDGNRLCSVTENIEECENLVTIVPLILIFLSQFVLGIGNTLYYSLGQTYLDDNTKKTNTPMMFAYAMSLRLLGPVFGFVLGYLSLNVYIDPTKTPLIERADPRWLGAWWFGWTILGFTMLLFSGLIGMFPKALPKPKQKRITSETPRILRKILEENPEANININQQFYSNSKLDSTFSGSLLEIPKMKDFPIALMRLLSNKLLMFNIISAVFYILGAAGFVTFLTKYIEVQFHKSAQDATIVAGPVTMVGMMLGLLLSGYIISKYRPSASKVLFWNVIIGIGAIFGLIVYMFIYCGNLSSMLQNESLTTDCNRNCSCAGVAYNPVCDESTGISFFSPCHAGCNSWDPDQKIYSKCYCAAAQEADLITTSTTESPIITTDPITTNLPTQEYFTTANLSTESVPNSTVVLTTKPPELTTTAVIITTKMLLQNESHADEIVDTTTLPNFKRVEREANSENTFMEYLPLVPGICSEDCVMMFYIFVGFSFCVHFMSSSGRIGNLLVNYRAVSVEDKSFAQGLALMLISLFALIPGPIVFGRIIDSTCLVWNENCGEQGNCQLYDQEKFRHYLNLTSLGLTIFGVFFDILVWYNGRDLDLYGEKERERLEEIRKKNQAISPLLPKKT